MHEILQTDAGDMQLQLQEDDDIEDFGDINFQLFNLTNPENGGQVADSDTPHWLQRRKSSLRREFI